VSRLPLRVRLVAGFVVAMVVLLTAAGAFVYWRVEYALDRGLDSELDQATAVITPLVDVAGQVSSPEAADATGAGWQVVDGTGHVVDSGGTAPAAPLVTATDLDDVGAGALTKDIGKLLPVADKPYRVQVTALEPGDHYLVVGVRRDHRDEALRELFLQLTLAGLGALAIAAVVGDILARAALRPVERYRRRAAEIAGGADGLRLDVPAGRDDEVTRLGHTLNEMLAALERSLERERRFVNEASHELRTPLTLIKSRIQLARRRPRTVPEHEVVLDELAVDVASLTDLADQLLTLGATDGASHGPEGHANVVEIATAVVERHRVTHPERADQLTLESAGAMTAAIDARGLERILTNLVDNAFTHGSPPVEVRLRPVPPIAGDRVAKGAGAAGWCLIEVSDAGAGMSPELMDRAAERFTRSAEARSRPGAGLGLAIVVALARSAGGELRICHGEHHTRHGQQVPGVSCEHSTAMTATVIVPRSAGHEGGDEAEESAEPEGAQRRPRAS
jgi:signal transduction histidine kinase